ncbi:MAG: hypothetical protein K8F25_07595, partial [Fimbriimonadaceae bacterium]|nr:hypothetical protein [Alphaproteobacteria bacterium]
MLSTILLVVILTIWEWGFGALGIPPYIIPPFSEVFAEFLVMLKSEGLLYHTGITAGEVVIG